MWMAAEAEDGIRDTSVTGVQTCALPISRNIERQTLSWLASDPFLDDQERGRELSSSLETRTGYPVRVQRAHTGIRVFPNALRRPHVTPRRSEERRVGKGSRCGWRPKQKTAYEIHR